MSTWGRLQKRASPHKLPGQKKVCAIKNLGGKSEKWRLIEKVKKSQTELLEIAVSWVCGSMKRAE